jgi:NTE family protein
LLAGVLAGCGTVAPAIHGRAEPSFTASAARDEAGAGVALVLSGGAARGFAHVGVIKALEAQGLKPDLVVGSSAGSIVGALYASGLGTADIEAAIDRMETWTFSDVAMPGLAFLPSSLGLVRGNALHRFIDAEARHRRIEDFPIRFAVVATDLDSGRPEIFNAGDAGLAVSASSAVPGIFTPVVIRGRRYVDGQISSPLPVEAARKLGARRVIAVDVVYPPEDAELTSTMRVLFQAFAITIHRIKQLEIASADVVIAPALEKTSRQLGFGDRERLVAAGESATMQALDRLRPLFERGSALDTRRASEAR